MEISTEGKPVKHSVAVLIRSGSRILTVRRPLDDDELPGIWGLPAGTRRGAETPEAVVERIGREKLGVVLKPSGVLTSGSQERPAYRLEMDLFEAVMVGVPSHPEWRWDAPDALRDGQQKGSLCCDLALVSCDRG